MRAGATPRSPLPVSESSGRPDPVVFTDSHSVASEPEKSSPSIKNGHGKWLLHG